MEPAQDPEVSFEPVTFDLAKGAKIRVEMAEFWEQLSESDRRLGHQPTLYFAIRTYSDEDTHPRRLTLHAEFRAGNDFDQCANQRLWTWLTDLAASRHRFVYDDVEDFLEEFAARMDEFSAIGDDAADHIHKSCGTKAPLPYEDPPRAEFPEDKSPRVARILHRAPLEADQANSDDAETVLGADEEGSENRGGSVGNHEADDGAKQQPDEGSNL